MVMQYSTVQYCTVISYLLVNIMAFLCQAPTLKFSGYFLTVSAGSKGSKGDWDRQIRLGCGRLNFSFQIQLNAKTQAKYKLVPN